MQRNVHEGHGTAARQEVIDPVCGMEVSEGSPHRHRVGDVEYRFCSAHCREVFAKHPEAFLQPDAQR